MPGAAVARRIGAPAAALLCCVLAGAVGGRVAAAEAAPRKHCTAKVERVFAANRYERVYLREDGSVLMCDKATGTYAELAGSDQTFLANTLVLRRRVAVAAVVSGGLAEEGIPRRPDNTSTSVVRVLMPRDRRRSRFVPKVVISNVEEPISGAPSAVFVPRLLLAANQTVVLSTCTLHFRQPYGCAADARIKILAVPSHAFIRYFDASNRTQQPTSQKTTLAEGAGIDPASLRLLSSGRTATWNQDGTSHRARVPSR